MIRILETITGIVLLLLAVACVSIAQTRKPATPDAGVTVNGACGALKHNPTLCNRVLLDGSAECAVCAAARGCLTPSHVYCVAAGCDDAKCRAR